MVERMNNRRVIERNEMLKEIFIFLLKYLSLSLLLHYLITHSFSLSWLEVFYARFISSILGLWMKVKVIGSTIFLKDLTVVISKDCTGWKSLVALFALMLATPPKLLHTSRRKKRGSMNKVVFIFFSMFYAIFFVWVVTNLRILSSILLTYYLFPNSFYIIHDVLWKSLSIIIVIIGWMLWLRIIQRKQKIRVSLFYAFSRKH